MSTVAPHPPAPPINPALRDSEQYIDDHIRRTRRALKLVDFASGVITLAVGMLGFLLFAGLIDHWLVPGGLGVAGRTVLFGVLLLGLSWLTWRQFVPLLRSINPVYAAHTIEKTAPTLKNSLLNVLLFRSDRRAMPAKVYYALEQQAAQRLHAAPADATIDHAALLRLGYALVAVLAACAIYAVLSPKDLATSAGRILAPWANISAPSRVQIVNIQPGETSVAVGERVSISAEVIGAKEDEPVRLRYSTEDEQLVDETITMARPTGAGRFAADLPRAADGRSGNAGAVGVQQNLEYWIEAGDARSQRFKLSVYTKPTIVVQRVRYEPPAYTGEPSRTVDSAGDIRGLEGTTVVVEALASQEIKSAYIDFEADGRSDVRMTVDGRNATASFVLQLKEDRRTPWHHEYTLRFTSAEGRTNEDPPQHRLEVTPDYPPEIRITQPEEPELSVHAADTVIIAVEARDPDFAIDRVRLMGRVHGEDVPLVELLEENAKDHVGLYKRQTRFVPADAKLKAGDVLEYWAAALDNRRPEANIAMSEHRRLRIVGTNDPANPQQNQGGQGGGGGNSPQDNGGAGDQGNPQAGGQAGGANQKGGDANQQAGDSGSEGGQAGGQQSAGENGKQGANGKTQQGQSGGEGAAGGQSTEQGGQSGGAAGQQSTGGGNSAEQQNATGRGAGGQEQGAQQPQQSPSGEGSSGGQPGAQGAASQGSAGGQQEKVSSAGDQDGDAIQRMQERLQELESGNNGGGENANPNGGAQNAAGQNPQSGEAASAAGQHGEHQAGGDPSGENSANPASGSDAEGANDAGGSDAAGRENPNGASQSRQGSGSPPPNGSAAGADAHANQGQGGSGADPGEAESSPEAGDLQQRDKPDAQGDPKTDDATPAAGARGKKESRSKGDQGGDRAGGGQTGAGQQAQSEGAGQSGSHTAADTGAGEAGEPGAGETGTEGGEQQTAKGQTGTSSGNQRGNGSETGDAQGNPQAGESGAQQPNQGSAGQNSQAGEAGSAAGQPGEPNRESPANPSDTTANPADQSGGQSTGGQQQGAGDSGGAQAESSDAAAGQQPGASSSGNPAGGNPAAGESAPSQPTDSPNNQGQRRGGSAANNGGGAGTSGGPVDSRPQEEPGGDAANLKYAREQTDLVLQRLDDQLAKHKVDAELLKRLGWTEAELKQFVQRWKGMKAAAAAPNATGEAQQQLDAALRSIGLRPGGPVRFRAASPADQVRDLNDSYRARAPVEYADRVRAYVKGAASDDK